MDIVKSCSNSDECVQSNDNDILSILGLTNCDGYPSREREKKLCWVNMKIKLWEELSL